MPTYTVHLTSPIRETFRTHQVAGLFDLSLDELAGERFAHTLAAELPGLDEDWTIGAIVGPSGSGKTTLARAAYGAALYEPQPWPEDAAIIDAMAAKCEGARVRGCGSEESSEPASETLALSHSHTLTPSYTLKHLLRILTAVGLASPPSWLKPYRVLSTGERFRADLARAILSHTRALSHPRTECESTSVPECERGLLVMDEFTSTLDRTIACTVSHALGKYLRSAASNPKSQIPNPKFICLSCHTDFLPWLAPDWVLDLGDGGREWERGRVGEGAKRRRTSTPNLPLTPAPALSLVRRPHWLRPALPPPPLPLAVRRVPQSLWPRFARHHYLSGGLSTAATCYAAFLDGATERRSDRETETTDSSLRHSVAPSLCLPSHQPLATSHSSPVAFCAILATLGHRRTKHITRLVVLPEYQGLGIGPRLAEEVAQIEAAKGFRVTITASHPAVLAWCSRSPRWRYLGLKKTGSTRQTLGGQRAIRCSTGRAVASFEFLAGTKPGPGVPLNAE